MKGLNRIYLVGYMGAGKTTAARRLAHRLGWEVVDTDALFEEKYKISVNDFFNKYDETLYRKLESEVLKATVHHRRCSKTSLKALKRSHISMCIK